MDNLDEISNAQHTIFKTNCFALLARLQPQLNCKDDWSLLLSEFQWHDFNYNSCSYATSDDECLEKQHKIEVHNEGV